MSKLDAIYNSFVNDGYKVLPETEQAEKELCEYLENNGLKYADFEDYMANAIFSNMRQGFKYGFRYAIELFFKESTQFSDIMKDSEGN